MTTKEKLDKIAALSRELGITIVGGFQDGELGVTDQDRGDVWSSMLRCGNYGTNVYCFPPGEDYQVEGD